MADEQEAIAGAMDIIAESISDEADYRTWIRNKTMKEGADHMRKQKMIRRNLSMRHIITSASPSARWQDIGRWP